MQDRQRPPAFRRKNKKEPQTHTGIIITALILGAISFIAWLIPAVGVFITLVGLGLSYLGRNASDARLVKAAFILNGIGLLGSLLNAFFGSYLGITGFI